MSTANNTNHDNNSSNISMKKKIKNKQESHNHNRNRNRNRNHNQKLNNNIYHNLLLQGCISQDVDIVKSECKKQKVELEIADEYGNTALIVASGSGNHKIVQILLEKMISLRFGNIDAQSEYCNHQNDMGCNSIMIAVAHGHYEIVNTLLKTNLLDLNLQNAYGYTALMSAVHYKHTKIIARLLEYGADKDIKDYNGHNALSRADGDEMRYMIIHTKSFREIEADAERAKQVAMKAALAKQIKEDEQRLKEEEEKEKKANLKAKMEEDKQKEKEKTGDRGKEEK